LAARHPDKVKELTKLYDGWLEQMAPPLSGAPKRYGGEATGKAKKREETKGGKKKKKSVE
jgi:hypothetical protein